MVGVVDVVGIVVAVVVVEVVVHEDVLDDVLERDQGGRVRHFVVPKRGTCTVSRYDFSTFLAPYLFSRGARNLQFWSRTFLFALCRGR